MAAHYRKIELQSPTDFTYLYANTVALSRRKLDLHLPPSAGNNEPDPMRERVRELVDEVQQPQPPLNPLPPKYKKGKEKDNPSNNRVYISTSMKHSQQPPPQSASTG